jgi:hypothetical protein
LVFGILNDERAMQRFTEGKEVNRFRPTIRSPLIDRDVNETGRGGRGGERTFTEGKAGLQVQTYLDIFRHI